MWRQVCFLFDGLDGKVHFVKNWEWPKSSSRQFDRGRTWPKTCKTYLKFKTSRSDETINVVESITFVETWVVVFYCWSWHRWGGGSGHFFQIRSCLNCKALCWQQGQLESREFCLLFLDATSCLPQAWSFPHWLMRHPLDLNIQIWEW